MKKSNDIPYIITEEQANALCVHFRKDYKQLDNYQICELLDKLIDSLITIDETVDDLPF